MARTKYTGNEKPPPPPAPPPSAFPPGPGWKWNSLLNTWAPDPSRRDYVEVCEKMYGTIPERKRNADYAASYRHVPPNDPRAKKQKLEDKGDEDEAAVAGEYPSSDSANDVFYDALTSLPVSPAEGKLADNNLIKEQAAVSLKGGREEEDEYDEEINKQEDKESVKVFDSPPPSSPPSTRADSPIESIESTRAQRAIARKRAARAQRKEKFVYKESLGSESE